MAHTIATKGVNASSSSHRSEGYISSEKMRPPVTPPTCAMWEVALAYVSVIINVTRKSSTPSSLTNGYVHVEKLNNISHKYIAPSPKTTPLAPTITAQESSNAADRKLDVSSAAKATTSVLNDPYFRSKYPATNSDSSMFENTCEKLWCKSGIVNHLQNPCPSVILGKYLAPHSIKNSALNWRCESLLITHLNKPLGPIGKYSGSMGSSYCSIYVLLYLGNSAAM